MRRGQSNEPLRIRWITETSPQSRTSLSCEKQMRVLVTGANSLPGSYLVDDLIRNGHRVAILLRPGANLWRVSVPLSDVAQLPVI